MFVARADRADKPAIIIELKWDKSARTAIDQIKSKFYYEALQGYDGEVVLVGVNYNTKTKEHECVIEKVQRAGNMD